eukprot:CAMPEP_0115731944 /NCGR_PEP_ID=MMETSP0272-20121206/84854_1 /TAXON_ID=71861 /ORGANISM="Scrippsiella trochoidea, Strain CCMP3099" /LENGTH=38 /DNA_ID= /DNA_START= /DNA_END= /DNA_ORIENTATION=
MAGSTASSRSRSAAVSVPSGDARKSSAKVEPSNMSSKE